MQKISPFLWFNDQAEEAVKFYSKVFKNSKIKTITRYGEAGPGPKGSVMTASINGVSWQIVPTIQPKLLTDRDPVKANRVMQAMLKMNKIDIAALKAAYGRKYSTADVLKDFFA